MGSGKDIQSPQSVHLPTIASQHDAEAQVTGMGDTPRVFATVETLLEVRDSEDESQSPKKRVSSARVTGKHATPRVVSDSEDDSEDKPPKKRLRTLTHKQLELEGPVSDDDPNYTMSPTGNDDQVDELPPATKVTEDNATAMEQLLQTMQAEKAQTVTNAPPPNESKHDKDVREDMERFKKLRSGLDQANNPFAGPLLECMQFYADRAMAIKTATGTSVKIMQVNSPSSASMNSVTFTVDEILALAPSEMSIDAWASDNILDVKIDIANANISRHKAYIAPIAALNMFIFRDADTDYYNKKDNAVKPRVGESISDARIRHLINDRNDQIDKANDSSNPRANPLDASLYPAGCMPADTTRLLLVYNISNSHWVLVEIEVDAAKTTGHVRLYNSLGGTTTDKRGITYATVKQEILGILQLIQRRPDLG